jgi:hypothetical protein
LGLQIFDGLLGPIWKEDRPPWMVAKDNRR